MLRSVLQQTHDDYDLDTWADYAALYAGGKRFFARIKRFLFQNELEPAPTYAKRLREAHYRCYLGGIVDYFASYLFSSPIVVRAKRDAVSVDPDAFYGEFKEDCDGKDNDIHVFVRTRIIEALTKRCAWWLVMMPSPPDGAAPESLAEWKKLGLDKAHVRSLDTEQVLDWEVDDDGQIIWAIVFSVKCTRPSPADQRQLIIERYDVYDRQNVERFELQYVKGKKPTKDVDVPSAYKRPHGFSCVPLVNVDVGESLWLANRVASPQIEHFRISCALTWGIRRTCYAMPVFNVEDQKRPPTMGAGYFLMIGPKDQFNWAAPPATPFDAMRNEVKDQKDEIFRVVHQMALGVDNNAAAIGRSAQSKMVDADAIRVVLGALGKLVRESIEKTYSLLSEGRGEDYDWSIEGLDEFDEIDPMQLVTAIQGAILLDIPSPTWHREVKTRAAIETVPDADQSVKDTIREEIEKNVTDESVLNPPTLEDEPDGDEDAGGPGDSDGDKGAKPPSRKPAPAQATA